MDDTAIEDELAQAQAAMLEAPARRQRAVMAARAAGWSKYKIAATLGVKEPTVTSIIKTAEKNAAKEEKRDA